MSRAARTVASDGMRLMPNGCVTWNAANVDVMFGRVRFAAEVICERVL
jgi:hypothetical protein